MEFDIESAFYYIDREAEIKANVEEAKRGLKNRANILYYQCLGILDGLVPLEPTTEESSPHDPYPRRVTDLVNFQDRSIRLREDVQPREGEPKPETLAVYIEQVSPIKRRLFRIAKESAQMCGETITLESGGLKNIGAAEALVNFIDKNLQEENPPLSLTA